MSKYIVKNCPCFFEENEEVNDYTCTWNGTEELACQDCTDCVMKQIVDLCNKYKDVDIIALHVIMLLQIKEV